MAKQGTAEKLTTKTVKPPRKGTARERIVKLKTSNPTLSERQIAELAGCSKSSVHLALERYGIKPERIEDYKSNRADIFAGLQDRIFSKLTDAALEKTPAIQLVTAASILYDKERLERGQSTSNVDVKVTAALEVELSQIDKEIERLKGKSGITPPENTPQVGSNTHPITTTLSGTNPT